MSHRLALFDFDGTLADSQDWFLGIFDQVADRFGYRRLAPGDRERLRGLETKAILHDLGVPTWKLPMIAKHVRELASGTSTRSACSPARRRCWPRSRPPAFSDSKYPSFGRTLEWANMIALKHDLLARTYCVEHDECPRQRAS